MTARTLAIDEKLRPHTGYVRPSHFRVRDTGPVDPEIVLRQPNLSLYCVDLESRRALFVETPPEVDLSGAPFLYDAQYDAAQRLVAVPFETLHRLAESVALDPTRLILVYSVGRCGSTLVSQALGAVDRVASLSEPDVLTQLLAIWGHEPFDAEQTALLKSCTLLQCVPGKLRGADAWALKFRSMVTALGPHLHGIFPDAKLVFLYRNAIPWTRSFLRMVGVGSAQEPVPPADIHELFGKGTPPFGPEATIPAMELAARTWAWNMENGRTLNTLDAPVFTVRYEALNAAPRATLTAMLAHCGLPTPAPNAFDAVLARDSQAGSSLSRETLAESSATLTEADIDALRAQIPHLAPNLTADTLLPGTYIPDA